MSKLSSEDMGSAHDLFVGFRSPSQFVSDEWEMTPDFLHSFPMTEESTPMSPLDLNDSLPADEVKTPLILPAHSINSPMISSSFLSLSSVKRETSIPIQNRERETEIDLKEEDKKTSDSLDLLDLHDYLNFYAIMDKLQSRAKMFDASSQGRYRTEVNNRVTLAALYQGMAQTIRKLGINEYAIVVPPTVREAAHYFNLGFHPIGTSSWRVGNFKYDTTTRMWFPHHPKFSH